MIAGLCESPLTFQAIIIWRDELNEGKIFLRDIIDLEATYAGPDAKNNLNPALLAVPLGPDGQPLVAEANGNGNGNGDAMPAAAAPLSAQATPAFVAPPAAPPSPTPFRAAPEGEPAEGEEKDPAEAAAESDMDDDEFENQMSLAAIEAELKPKVVETFDKIADTTRSCAACRSRIFQPAPERDAVAGAGAQVQEVKDEIIVEVKSLRLK